MFFSVVFFKFEVPVTIYFSSIGFAATLFTPETPKVFCGLKDFTISGE